jgi:asparaginyl-tRNA synthetase
MSRVYTFGPTFRAEESHSPRHLAEFWMIEPEFTFASLDDLISLSEDLVKRVIADVQRENSLELDHLNDNYDKDLKARLKKTLDSKFVVMSYHEAVKALSKANDKFSVPIHDGMDLQREHEKYLCEVLLENVPVFVVRWPKAMKPFYMKTASDGQTVENLDLLLPNVGELVGGSVREERLDVLEANMKAKGMNRNAELDWYLELRRFGTVPHGGFGLGFERFVQFLTGMKNIKDTILVPRATGSCKF